MWLDQICQESLPLAVLADLERLPDARAKLGGIKQKCPSTSVAFFRQKNSESHFITVFWCTEEKEVELRDQMKSEGFEEALVPINLGLLRSHDYMLYIEKSRDGQPTANQITSEIVGQLLCEDILEHSFVHIGIFPASMVDEQTDNFDHVHLRLKSNQKGSNGVIIPCRGRWGRRNSIQTIFPAYFDNYTQP